MTKIFTSFIGNRGSLFSDNIPPDIDGRILELESRHVIFRFPSYSRSICKAPSSFDFNLISCYCVRATESGNGD